MSLEVTLLVLRVITGGLLLIFMGAVLVVLWRDYRAAAGTAERGQREYGRLVVIHHTTDEIGHTYPLLPITSLGRSPANTIVLDEPFCSQEHALIMRRSGQWWLEDRRSSNGTLLNGEAVSEPVVVSSGDVIGIGRLMLKIELDQ